MLRTLGLDDDLDPVELVIEIEKAFDVAIGNEAEIIFNVGHMFDSLRAKIPASKANGKCASAMAFYRLRRALNNLQLEACRTPSCDLSKLPVFYTKAAVKIIEKDSGLRMPRPADGPLGKVGNVVFLVGSFGTMALLLAATSFAESRWSWIAPAALFIGGVLGGLALMRCDAGRLPTDCRTLGALAAKPVD